MVQENSNKVFLKVLETQFYKIDVKVWKTKIWRSMKGKRILEIIKLIRIKKKENLWEKVGVCGREYEKKKERKNGEELTLRVRDSWGKRH